MFAYYAQLVPNYSDKIKSLVDTKEFPLKEEAVKAFESMKMAQSETTLGVINEDKPFTVGSCYFCIFESTRQTCSLLLQNTQCERNAPLKRRKRSQCHS